MNIVRILCAIVSVVGGVIFLVDAGWTYANAESALHQILAYVALVIAALFWCAFCVCLAGWESRPLRGRVQVVTPPRDVPGGVKV